MFGIWKYCQNIKSKYGYLADYYIYFIVNVPKTINKYPY